MGVIKHKIVRLGKNDAYYSVREHLFGQTGVVSKKIGLPQGGNYIACDFKFDDPTVFNRIYPSIDKTQTKFHTAFYRVLLRKVK